MRYTGASCPICGTVFSEDDDIVVCPDCGTPHHRKCYLQNKDCANAALHADGFSWTPSESEPPADSAFVQTDAANANPVSVPNGAQHVHDGHRIVFCPQCGAQNAAEEPACTQCGARLYNTENQPFTPPVQLPDMTARPFYVRSTIIAPTDTIDGNTVGDTAEYVRTSAERYIPKFYKLDKSGKKLSWNWAAFFFSPCWFFYRKLYAVGGVLLALLLTVTGATMTPRYLQAFSAYAEVVMQSSEAGQTYEEMLAAAEPTMQTLAELPETRIQNASMFLLHLFSGLAANYLYKKKAGKDILRLREQKPSPEEYRFLLFRRGGTSLAMGAASAMIYMLGLQALLNILLRFLL